MFTEKFLDSIKKHQITVIQNNDDTKIFQASIPNKGSVLAFTVIYQSDRVIITGDMGNFVLGNLLNPYSFFLKNQAAFSFHYMASKLLAEDCNFRTHIFDEDEARKIIEGLFQSYVDENSDFDEEQIYTLKDKIKNLDFGSKLEVENWLYGLEPDELEIFEELYIGDCEVISYQFSWCVQAIIWITREVSKKEK